MDIPLTLIGLEAASKPGEEGLAYTRIGMMRILGLYKNRHADNTGNRNTPVKNMTYWRDKNYTVKCRHLLCTHSLEHLRSSLYLEGS